MVFLELLIFEIYNFLKNLLMEKLKVIKLMNACSFLFAVAKLKTNESSPEKQIKNRLRAIFSFVLETS